VGVPDNCNVPAFTEPGEVSPEKFKPAGIDPVIVHDIGGVWVPFTV
jgi:hypothetical protein